MSHCENKPRQPTVHESTELNLQHLPSNKQKQQALVHIIDYLCTSSNTENGANMNEILSLVHSEQIDLTDEYIVNVIQHLHQQGKIIKDNTIKLAE